MKKNVFIFYFSFIFLIISGNGFATETNAEKKPKALLTKEEISAKFIEREHIMEDYLPIFGKKMREHGLTPPKPFFISMIYYHMEIPQIITNARGFIPQLSGGNPNPDDPNNKGWVNVDMKNAKITTESVGVRAGFNLFPFLSLFGVYVHTEGATKFTAVAHPSSGFKGYTLNQSLKFKADTGAIGTALSYGFRLGRVIPFGVFNINYAWSSTDRTANIIETLITGARVGLLVPLPKQMKISGWIGGQYQIMMGALGDYVEGSYPVTIPGDTIVGIPDDLNVQSQYKANAKYASPWAMNAGISFSPIKYFDVVLEFGFLSRFTSLLALQANF